jgi:hypothetical protein
MSRPVAHQKAQEVPVATYTPPFVELLRVDGVAATIELAGVLGKVHFARRAVSMGLLSIAAV